MFLFASRNVGSHKTSTECKLHFERYYIENRSGDFKSCPVNENEESGRFLRVDEPITCGILAQQMNGAPLGGPIRPLPGSTIFKGEFYSVVLYFIVSYNCLISFLATKSIIYLYHSELAGYNAARADFDNEYDNGVELLIRDIEVDDRMYQITERKDALKPFIKFFENENEESNQLNAELSVAMLSIYKNKLRARNKRKR